MIRKELFRISVLMCLAFLFYQCEMQTESETPNENCAQDECCAGESSTAESETSEITCPSCGHKAIESLPTDVCVIHYTCKKCGSELTPDNGDCCVYCTYGTHKCPSKQE